MTEASDDYRILGQMHCVLTTVSAPGEHEKQYLLLDAKVAGKRILDANGKKKNYNQDKGYGFIAQDEGEDLFFHILNILKSPSVGEIKAGQRVKYEITRGKKGLEAENIQLILIPFEQRKLLSQLNNAFEAIYEGLHRKKSSIIRNTKSKKSNRLSAQTQATAKSVYGRISGGLNANTISSWGIPDSTNSSAIPPSVPSC